jgi:hypothetical protein
MRIVAVLLALASASCATARVIDVVNNLHVDRHLMCPDGAPVRILQDPRCESGICGFTCAPERWQTPWDRK